MRSFFSGFEKRAGLSPQQRRSYEKEMYDFNREQTTFKKLAPRGMKAFGTLGAAAGGIGGALSGAGVAGWKGALGGGLAGALGGGLAGAGTGAAITGGASLFHQKRGPDYLKKIPDKNLEIGIKGIRKFRAGDPKAMNKAHWESLAAEATDPRDKAIFTALRRREDD